MALGISLIGDWRNWYHNRKADSSFLIVIIELFCVFHSLSDKVMVYIAQYRINMVLTQGD